MQRWEIWIDTGGTFTDCLARDPGGRLHRAKVLSSGCLRRWVRAGSGERGVQLAPPGDETPAGLFTGCRLRRLGAGAAAPRILGHDPGGCLRLEEPLDPPLRGEEACEIDFEEAAPLVAARCVTGTARDAPLPPLRMRLATTRGTNALLERSGAPVALFVTAGFADLLAIGTQQRDELFTLRPTRPAPLYAAVVEVRGRLDAAGHELEPLVLDGQEPVVGELLERGIETAAVAFLHSYRNPQHEERCGRWLAERGFRHVSLSSALAPRIQILPRAETAVLDAYLSEPVRGHLASVAGALAPGSLQVMTSAGGLVPAPAFRPKDSLLSGPAGGVVGAAAAAAASGCGAILAFDMGGTSTDVARWVGDLEYRFETRIGGSRLFAPALAIETVAAGGGSICSFDGNALRVGPESAGATPGPACYGAGGPLTLTDVNLLLGRLEPGAFGIPLAPAAAEAALARLQAALAAGGSPKEREPLLAGLLRIADERMAEALRRVSIRRGFEPADHVLLAFGGAGGQHACSVAELLEIGTVLVPADAGLLSALGLGAARLERFAERQVLAPLGQVAGEVEGWVAQLAAAARGEVLADDPSVRPEEVEVRRVLASLRLVGQEATLEVEMRDGGADLGADFRRRYRERYGYGAEDRAVEIESLRVIVTPPATPLQLAAPASAARGASPPRRRPAWCGGSWRDVSVVERATLAPGEALPGPALVLEPHCTTVVEPAWSLEVDAAGAMVLRR